MKFTMRQISEAQQAFEEIRILPKGPKIALKMLHHRRNHIQPHIDALLAFLKECIPKYTGGAEMIDPTHKNYQEFKKEYEEFLAQEIDMDPFPVKLETLINAVEHHNMQVAAINKRFADPSQKQPLVKLTESMLGQVSAFFTDTMDSQDVADDLNDAMNAIPESQE